MGDESMGFKIKIPGMPGGGVIPAPVNLENRHIPIGVTEATKEKLVEAMSPEKKKTGNSPSRAAEAQNLAQIISPRKPDVEAQSPKSPNSILGGLSGSIYPSVRRRSIEAQEHKEAAARAAMAQTPAA